MGVGVLNRLNGIGLGFLSSVSRKSKSGLTSIIFRSRFPIVFIIICIVINVPTWGELILNPAASILYFGFGYSLYKNSSLFTFLKAQWKYYLLAGLVGFTLFIIVTLAIASNLPIDIDSQERIGGVETEKHIEFLRLLQYLLKIIGGVLFSYAFIGLAEKRFGSFDVRLRFIADGAYWMYLIHLPIVSLSTFLMFNLHILIEIKFLIAIATTSIICLGTYKYLVKSTLIGVLLNGRRYPFNATRL